MSHYGNYKPDFFKTDEKANNLRFKLFWTKIYRNIIPALKKLCMGIILALAVISCKPKQIIVEKDKLVYVTKDSIVNRDSTIYVPVEVYRDYSSLVDTLRLSTSLAESWSVVDTNMMILIGEIKNLKAVQVKYVKVDKWHTRDSIVEVEKPLPYPVIEEKRYIPTFAWICMVWAAISIVLLGIRLYLKFFKH